MVDGEVFVQYLSDIPLAVKGITIPNSDGTFTVYINASYPPEIQETIYQHELYHIEHDHLYTYLPVKVAEAQAEGKAQPVEDVPSVKPARRKRITAHRLPRHSIPIEIDLLMRSNRFARAERQWLYGDEY